MARNASLEEELSESMKQTETLRSLGEERTRKQTLELTRQEKVRRARAPQTLGEGVGDRTLARPPVSWRRDARADGRAATWV